MSSAAGGRPESARASRSHAGAPLAPFDRVVDEHGPAVLRFCVSRAGASGEDVFQETMIAALRAYPELRDPAAVRGWLFSIAHRKTIDAGRAAQRTPRPSGSPEEIEVAAGAAGRAFALGGGFAVGWEAEQATGEATIARMGDDVWQRVRELPTKQREAITLRYLGDLTNGEVAKIMGTSEEAARRSVFEGVRRLRKLMD